jgi:hypothetical protein
MEEDKKVKKICKNFMYKNCQREDCKFIHDNTICFYYWKYGSCKFESECKKSHLYKRQGIQESNETQKVDDNYSKNNDDKFKAKINDKDGKDKRNKDKYNNKKKKNTECFVPKTDPVDLRVVLDLRSTFIKDCAHCNYDEPIPELTSRDVLFSPKLFDDFGKYEIYNKLVSEIENCGIPETELLKMWHGNDKIEGTHLIVDDYRKWKEHCPTFNMIISRLKQVFKMDIKSTRFNWYRDSDHWKPFHHDAAAIKVDKALTQNFTVAVSFGATKDAAFEHAKTKTTISMPQQDGTIYSFTNDTNSIWRHGILQDKNHQKLGRISIIAWGWVNNVKQI